MFVGEPETEWSDGGYTHKAVMGKGEAREGGRILGRVGLVCQA